MEASMHSNDVDQSFGSIYNEQDKGVRKHYRLYLWDIL